jgi:hypothetical protein
VRLSERDIAGLNVVGRICTAHPMTCSPPTWTCAKLDTLTTQHSAAANPDLLDALPQLGDIVADAPARLQQPYDAFDLQMLYNKEDHQVSIYAAITHATPATLAAILADCGTPGTGSTPGSSTPSPQPADTRLPISDSPRTPAGVRGESENLALTPT